MKFAATAVIGTEQKKLIQYLKDIWENIQSVFATMGLVDYLDILLLAYLIY